MFARLWAEEAHQATRPIVNKTLEDVVQTDNRLFARLWAEEAHQARVGRPTSLAPTGIIVSD